MKYDPIVITDVFPRFLKQISNFLFQIGNAQKTQKKKNEEELESPAKFLFSKNFVIVL